MACNYLPGVVLALVIVMVLLPASAQVSAGTTNAFAGAIVVPESGYLYIPELNVIAYKEDATGRFVYLNADDYSDIVFTVDNDGNYVSQNTAKPVVIKSDGSGIYDPESRLTLDIRDGEITDRSGGHAGWADGSPDNINSMLPAVILGYTADGRPIYQGADGRATDQCPDGYMCAPDIDPSASGEGIIFTKPKDWVTADFQFSDKKPVAPDNGNTPDNNKKTDNPTTTKFTDEYCKAHPEECPYTAEWCEAHPIDCSMLGPATTEGTVGNT